MNHYIKIFLSSILAGCAIVFGATCYLMCAIQGTYLLKVIGSFMFGIGLFTIIHYNLWLYTGKAGYVLDNKPIYIIDLIICLIGNLVGVILLSLILKGCGVIDINGASGNTIREFSKTLVEGKQNEKWYQIFILSFMCGVMIYLAVDGHKRASYPLAKVLFVFMPISLFILLGFEHVIANACYYTYAGVFNGKTVLWFFLMALGNISGSMAFEGGLKLVNKYAKKEEIDIKNHEHIESNDKEDTKEDINENEKN